MLLMSGITTTATTGSLLAAAETAESQQLDECVVGLDGTTGSSCLDTDNDDDDDDNDDEVGNEDCVDTDEKCGEWADSGK